MIINSILTGEKPRLNLAITIGACAVTAIALSIIASPLFWSCTLVAGTVAAIIPIACVLRARRIERDQIRNAELIPHKDKITNYDSIFHEEHAASEKYQKLRQRLLDSNIPLNLTFEKIDELIKLNR